MSEPEIVHPVPVDEVEGWMASLRTALLADPTGPDSDARLNNRRRAWNPDLVWGVRDRGSWVGSLAVEQRTVTVPGAGGGTEVLAVDAVTGVSVAATHRRRGLLRAMITRSLQAAVERGDPISALIAAEWPIYGRYGYAPATASARYRYHVRRAGAAPAGGPPRGMRPVTPAELGSVATGMFERARRRHAGQMDRAGDWWARDLGLDGYRAMADPPPNWFVHEDADGECDGVVGWHATSSVDLDGTPGSAAVDLLAAAGDEAYRDLWAYVAGIDLVGEVTLAKRSVEEPIRWLLDDARALQHYATIDELWLRLLDVPAALGGRGYAVDGRLVLDVIDADTGGYAAGTFLLEVQDGIASCTRASTNADLRMSQRTLASAYLGGHRLASLALAGGVEELTAGALSRADLMFSTPTAPWNQTSF